VQQPTIREIRLSNLLWLLRRIEMPKRSATPVKASRRVAVEEDEEDEEEVVVATSAKKASASVPKSAKNGKVAATPARKTSAKDDEDGTYTPNQNSMRDFIMRAMKRGGTSTEIKKRAARFAEKKGIDSLSDPKAYKNFDVAYYAKFLKTKGFDVEIDEEGDSYSLSA
jgi:hypothetical protein